MSNDVPPSFSTEYVSKLNSSTANLGSGASFTGTGEDVLDFETLAISFKADQNVTIQVLQSIDNSNWDVVDSYFVSANSGDSRTFELLSSYFQIIVTNTGGSATTFLRLQCILSPGVSALPRSLTQLGNLKTAILESIPMGVSGTVGVSGNVNVQNFPSVQGVSGTVNIGNFPVTQGVSGLIQIGSVSGVVGVSGIVNVNVQNFPQTQGVSGSVSILNFPAVQGVSGLVQVGAVSGIVGVSGIVNVNVTNFPATQGVSGSVSILNFPQTQGVSGLLQIGAVSGIVGVSGTVAVSGGVNVLNFPVIQGVSGTVNIGNFPAIQGVSGLVQIGAVSGIVGVSGIVSVSVTNFPSTQGVSGSVSVLNFPNPQGVSGTVNIGNFPTIQGVSGLIQIGAVSGIVGVSGTVAVSGGVNVLNFPVTQGVSGTVNIGNFPAVQGVSGLIQIGAVSGIVGVSGIVNVNVQNFPQTQGVSGSVSVLNFPNPQGVSGTVNIGNFPAVQGVSGIVQIGAVSGIVGVSGTVNVNVQNFPAIQGVSGSVSILNFPVTQGVSGLVQIGAVSGIVGVSGIVNVNVQNFPQTQGVSGSVSILNFPNPQGVSGTVNIGNFPAVQGVSGIVQIGAVSGIVGVSGIVNVNVQNFPSTQGVSGSVSVLNFPNPQGVSGTVNIGNFPSVQGVSGIVQIGAVSGIVGVSGIVNVNVQNFPQTQGVSGSVSVLNFPNPQGVSGSVSILNFPQTQGVSGIVTVLQGTNPWGAQVSGVVGVSGTVAVNVGNFPAIQGVSGSVSVLNFPQTQGVSGTVTVLQGTQPWGAQVSGIVGVSGTTVVTGTVNVGNFPAIQGVSGSISVLNFPSTQGVSGTVTVLQGTNPWGAQVSGIVGVSGTVLVRDVADGSAGAAVPSFITQVGGRDVSGNLQAIDVDSQGNQYAILTGPRASVTGFFSTVNGFSRVLVSPEASSLLSDKFDSGVIDSIQWTTTTGSGGTVTSSGGSLVITTSTTTNAFGVLSSVPTFMQAANVQLQFAVDIRLETSPLATGVHRFWGFGSAGANTTVSPLTDAVGFEIDVSGNLNAVVYASGTKIFSQTLTAITDGGIHRYSLQWRTDKIVFYVDSNDGVSAVASNQTPGVQTLPVRIHTINDGSVSKAPVVQVSAVGIGDTGRNSTAISDGIYGWRKATVDSTKSLYTSVQQQVTQTDINGSGTISALNGAVTITCNGCSTIYLSITGTWVAALSLQGDSGDGTWNSALAILPYPSGALASILGSNVSLIIPCGGYKQIRLKATAYTSGTATVTYNAGVGTNAVQAFNLIPAALQTTVTAQGTAQTPAGGILTVQGDLQALPVRTEETRLLLGGDFSLFTNTRLFTATATGSGTLTATGGVGTLSTGTTANSAETLQSIQLARFIPESKNSFFTNLKISTTGVANSTKRWGAFTTTDGYFFQYSGSTFSIVTRLTSSDTAVASGSFSGSQPVIDTNYHLYHIIYDDNVVRFYQDYILLHTVSSGANILAGTVHLPARLENTNSGGSTTNVTLLVKSLVIKRLGDFPVADDTYYFDGSGVTTTIKTGPGRLKNVTIARSAGIGNVTTTLFDNTAGSGTTIFQVVTTGNGVFTFTVDAQFNTGLTAVNAANNVLSLTWD